MNNFLLLLKKEVWENWVNWKIPIILLAAVVCAILGTYMNYLSVKEYYSLAGYPYVLPATSMLLELYSNITTFLILFAPFLVMGAVAGEIKNHNAAALLIKPVGRTGYILSKWLTYFLMFGIAVAITVFIGAIYANNLATDANAFSNIKALLATIGLFWVFIAFAVAVMILLSTITNSQIIAGILGLCVLMACLYNPIGSIGELIPGRLLDWIKALLSNSTTWQTNDWPALWITVTIIVASVFASIIIMKRKEL